MGLIAVSFGHKGHLSVALTWRGAGDVAEELLDASVTQGAPEGASCEHVEDGVDGAADEDQGSGDEGHGAPDTLKIIWYVVEGVFSSQDGKREEVSYVMRRPANGKHNHHAGDQDCGLALGLEGHLSDTTAQAAIADHEDGEG